MSVVHIHGVFLIFIPFGIVCKWRETSNKRSTENAGYPNGLPNWGTFSSHPETQRYQDY